MATPEPPHRINQIYIEPILADRAIVTPGLTVLFRTRIESFEQVDDGVTAKADDLNCGRTLAIKAKFMIGCDGGRSMVRKAIGATLSGTEVVSRVQSSYVRAPKLLGMLEVPPAWATSR